MKAPSAQKFLTVLAALTAVFRVLASQATGQGPPRFSHSREIMNPYLPLFTLLGNLAQYAGPGRKVESDGKHMKVKNIKEMNACSAAPFIG